MRTGTVQRGDQMVRTQVEFYGPADGQPIIMSHGWGNTAGIAKRQLSDVPRDCLGLARKIQ